MLLVANRQTDKPTDKGENIIFAVVELKKHWGILLLESTAIEINHCWLQQTHVCKLLETVRF